MSSVTWSVGYSIIDSIKVNVHKVKRVCRCADCGRMIRAGEYATKQFKGSRGVNAVCVGCKPLGIIYDRTKHNKKLEFRKVNQVHEKI
jgi:hypothetical protein